MGALRTGPSSHLGRSPVTLAQPTGDAFRAEVWRIWPQGQCVEVSNLGRIRSTLSEPPRLLSPSPRNQHGHLAVNVGSRTDKSRRVKYVHTLVIETFGSPRPKGHEVRHLDGNHLNNKPENLTWGTRLQNMSDARKHGTTASGTQNYHHKLKDADVLEIRASTLSDTELGEKYGVSRHMVGKIRLRRNWRHL